MSINKKIKKLTSGQVKELRQAFDLFDADGSGDLSLIELKKALVALGVTVSDREARQMFAAIDLDKNGLIEFHEFAEVIADSYFKKLTRAEIVEAFRRFDHNHDGYIEADELKAILTKLGRNYSNEEIRRMIAQVDEDGNGKICIEEFAALIDRDS
ncbi:unnamed protein product [Rotaria magnacalcarata]|uniref:EF-hand domain-containing protein n=1 Tax=Rotaria magnacalcarata TaxID=392030 RepID=A0A8S2MM59_9BILA|nr:unnamed protein product [Rotaria magnacalcarata]